MLALRHYSTMLKPKHCRMFFRKVGCRILRICRFAECCNTQVFGPYHEGGSSEPRTGIILYVCACVLSLFNVTYYMPGGPSRISFTGVPMFVQENADFQRPCRKNRDQEVGFMKI